MPAMGTQAETTGAYLAELGALAPVGYLMAFHIRYGVPTTKFQTYPPDWIERYTSRAYQLRDPMVAWGFTRQGQARWSEISIPDPFGIMADAARHGLTYGAAVACGPILSRSICGFARDDREFNDAEIDRIVAIVHDMHDRLDEKTLEPLTPGQLEALRAVAQGDRQDRVAAQLGISRSALKERLRGARGRLGARTLAEALKRAAERDLL